MLYASTWTIVPSKVLTRSELRAVLTDLERRDRRSPNARLNEVIMRLACCCGLRMFEWKGLGRISVRKECAKGRRARVVPLWWDSGTLTALNAWATERVAGGATLVSHFVGSLQAGRSDRPLSRHTLRKRFKTACKQLGRERSQQLTIHHGQTLEKVRRARRRQPETAFAASRHLRLMRTTSPLSVPTTHTSSNSAIAVE